MNNENKNIKDYLPFYLGCDIKEYDEVFKLDMVTFDGFYTHGEFHQYESKNDNAFKLMLRPLNDMSADEAWQCFSEANDDSRVTNPKLAIQDETWFPSWNIHQWAAALNYLRKQGFDCDGLIKAGLAIDKTTLKISTNEHE